MQDLHNKTTSAGLSPSQVATYLFTSQEADERRETDGVN